MAGRRPISSFHSSFSLSAFRSRSRLRVALKKARSNATCISKSSSARRSFLASVCFSTAFLIFNSSTIRIAGVLQRIAICYLIASLIFLTTKVRTQLLIALALLVVYWLLMTRLAAPGYAPGDLSKEGSIASFIDRVILGPHIWRQGRVYDPEGLLSTIPAVATTLFGVLTGHWLRSERTRIEKVVGMFVAGAVCVVLGWAWNSFFPINKPLWTSSYVLFTAGLGLQLLALCYWVIDIKGYRRWAWPFEVFGVNALALFVGSALMVKLMGLISFHAAMARRSLRRDGSFATCFCRGRRRSMRRCSMRSRLSCCGCC